MSFNMAVWRGLFVVSPSRLCLNPTLARNFSGSLQRLDGSLSGFMNKLFGSDRSVERATDAHSKVLTKEETVYELEFQDVKPEYIEDYIDLVSDAYPKISKDDQFAGELVGSWTTMFGRLDRAIHLWKYQEGYNAVVAAKNYMRVNQEYRAFAKKRRHMIHNRENQLLHAFNFWGEVRPREPSHIYELRTYYLKPGTLIGWGNNWGRAIHLRQEQGEDVGGFFSQIGELYMVHHIWAYNDMVSRKEIRQNLWNRPGWDDCVANTVPLTRRMESSVMVPLPHSQLQ